MSTEAQALLRDWSPPIAINVAIVLTAVVYCHGWLTLRRSSPYFFPPRRLFLFLLAMVFLWIAIGSPLAAFDESSLTVHMVQHILLMLVVPPLALLGAPAMPLLHGLPCRLVQVLSPLLRWRTAQAVGRFLTHPLVGWILGAVALIAWHVPAAFELALRSDGWHEVEHACFLFTSILFWWPVAQPFPSEGRWPRWSIPLYLFLGMFPGSVLGAFLTFSDRVIYAAYARTYSVFDITPLQDQVLAGALMWAFGFFVCFVPAVLITLKLLSPASIEGATVRFGRH